MRLSKLLLYEKSNFYLKIFCKIQNFSKSRGSDPYLFRPQNLPDFEKKLFLVPPPLDLKSLGKLLILTTCLYYHFSASLYSIISQNCWDSILNLKK